MSAETDRLGRLARLAHDRLGIDLGRGAVNAALERYTERFSGEITSFDIESKEFQNFIDAVTVQHSWLFRDAEQLEMATDGLAGLGRRSHVWVPACATGEDVYSVLALAEARGLDVRALGTDVHAEAIEGSRRALYGAASTRHVPPEHQHILEDAGERGGDARRIIDRLRDRASFRTQNLLDAPPRSPAVDGRWDLILCRNVLIYFSPENAARALRNMRDALSEQGTLILGASDILTALPEGLVACEAECRVVFRRETARTFEVRAEPIAEHVIAEQVLAEHAIAARAAAHRASSPQPVAPRAEKAPLRQRGPQPLLRGASEESAEDEAESINHLIAGIDLHLNGDLAGALAKLRAALYLNPMLWPASYYLALCFEGLGRPVEARRAYAITGRLLDRGAPALQVPGHDFSFLERDVAAIVRQRAASPRA